MARRVGVTARVVVALAVVGAGAAIWAGRQDQQPVAVQPVVSSTSDNGESMTVSISADSVRRVVVELNGHKVSDTKVDATTKADPGTVTPTPEPSTTKSRAPKTAVPHHSTSKKTTTPKPTELPGSTDLSGTQSDYERAHAAPQARATVPAPVNSKCGPPQVDPALVGSCPG